MDTAIAATASSQTPLRTAQGVICGAWALAFEFGWARSIIDQFELVAVPQAHDWLVGAANVDGELLPAVDLSRLMAPTEAPFARHKDQRLLVCGVGAEAVALVFTRMPQMLRFEVPDARSARYAPPAIREAVRGIATNERGESYLDVDGPRLVELLASLSA